MMTDEDWAEFMYAELVRENLLRKWMEAFGQPTQKGEPNGPLAHLYHDLVIEEAGEFVRAYDDGLNAKDKDDLNGLRKAIADTWDGAGDTKWVSDCYILATGGSCAEVNLEIARSNFSKLGKDGKPIHDENGKVMKGPDFFPPKLVDMVEETLGL